MRAHSGEFVGYDDARVAARADRVLFTKDGQVVSDLTLGMQDGEDLDARTEKVSRQMAAVRV